MKGKWSGERSRALFDPGQYQLPETLLLVYCGSEDIGVYITFNIGGPLICVFSLVAYQYEFSCKAIGPSMDFLNPFDDMPHWQTLASKLMNPFQRVAQAPPPPPIFGYQNITHNLVSVHFCITYLPLAGYKNERR